MVKEWIRDIKVKTENMDKKQRMEYIFAYYWYHILLITLAIGLCFLFLYHVSWGRKKTDFSLVMVNQEVDFARDKEVAESFSSYSGMNSKNISIDSDYLISYENVNLKGVNESSFEKFFLNWASKTIDAIVMPESFLKYCEKQNGEIASIEELVGEETLENIEEDCIFENNGRSEGIYVEKTKLSQSLKCSKKDKVLLVFPKELKHKEACRQFLNYIFQE